MDLTVHQSVPLVVCPVSTDQLLTRPAVDMSTMNMHLSSRMRIMMMKPKHSGTMNQRSQARDARDTGTVVNVGKAIARIEGVTRKC